MFTEHVAIHAMKMVFEFLGSLGVSPNAPDLSHTSDRSSLLRRTSKLLSDYISRGTALRIRFSAWQYQAVLSSEIRARHHELTGNQLERRDPRLKLASLATNVSLTKSQHPGRTKSGANIEHSAPRRTSAATCSRATVAKTSWARPPQLRSPSAPGPT